LTICLLLLVFRAVDGHDSCKRLLSPKLRRR
jgi:hypothetical protein